MSNCENYKLIILSILVIIALTKHLSATSLFATSQFRVASFNRKQQHASEFQQVYLSLVPWYLE